MVNGDHHLENVFRQVLLDILASDFARLELLIVNCEKPSPARPTPAGKAARRLRILRDPDRRRIALYTAFQKYNLRREYLEPKPRERVNCEDILGPIQRLEVTPARKHFVHRLPDDAIATIRSHDLDVILRFGFNIRMCCK